MGIIFISRRTTCNLRSHKVLIFWYCADQTSDNWLNFQRVHPNNTFKTEYKYAVVNSLGIITRTWKIRRGCRYWTPSSRRKASLRKTRTPLINIERSGPSRCTFTIKAGPALDTPRSDYQMLLLFTIFFPLLGLLINLIINQRYNTLRYFQINTNKIVINIKLSILHLSIKLNLD